MKVFISWSGSLSKQLAEAFRDWLPAVIQLAQPYFTPSDIEKGTRWATDIAKELDTCHVGIICVTRDNLHSDWILFEAGALSKSLDKAYVCPLLFGINNTDLSGPLKQFQTTAFEKSDVHKLVAVINGRLGDNKLPSKTLDTVFDKWWPDLEKRVHEILEKENTTSADTKPIRADRELIEEILLLSRANSRNVVGRAHVSVRAITDLVESHIDLHDQQVAQDGGYQEALDVLKSAHIPLEHIASRYKGTSEKFDELWAKLQSLSYESVRRDEVDFEDIETRF